MLINSLLLARLQVITTANKKQCSIVWCVHSRMKDDGKHEVSSSVKSSAEPVGQPTGGEEVLALPSYQLFCAVGFRA